MGKTLPELVDGLWVKAASCRETSHYRLGNPVEGATTKSVQKLNMLVAPQLAH